MHGLSTAAAAAISLAACTATPAPDCICTSEFRSVTVTVVDTLGVPVLGLKPAITVRSTGRTLIPSAPPIDAGWYYVVTDGDHGQFALDGDTLHFAVSSLGRSAAANFVVDAPGPCHCHVHLISGPDTLVLR